MYTCSDELSCLPKHRYLAGDGEDDARSDNEEDDEDKFDEEADDDEDLSDDSDDIDETSYQKQVVKIQEQAYQRFKTLQHREIKMVNRINKIP